MGWTLERLTNWMFGDPRVSLGAAWLAISLSVSTPIAAEAMSSRPLGFPFLTEEAEMLSHTKYRHHVQLRFAGRGGLSGQLAHQERVSWRVEQSLGSQQIGVWIPYVEPADQASGVGDVEGLWRWIHQQTSSPHLQQTFWARVIMPSGDSRRSRGWESWGGRVGWAHRRETSRAEFQFQAELTQILAGRSVDGSEANFQFARIAGQAVIELSERWALQAEALALEDVQVMGPQTLRRSLTRSMSLLGVFDVDEDSWVESGRLAVGIQQNWRAPLESESRSDLAIVVSFRALQPKRPPALAR